MANKKENRLIVGLDIGTSKVLTIVGQVNADNIIEVIGYGHHPSVGMRKGVVANIEATINAIQRSVEEAELMTGCHVISVFAGIAGAHIRSVNSSGAVRIAGGEVTQTDVDRVIEAAQALNIPKNEKILHIIPQEFIIDDQDGVRHPVGMTGVRLEVNLHIVMGSVSSEQNIIKCIHRCGLEVDEIILEQLASSASVLSEDEKELGVCLVDIGGGTTDIAVYVDGAIRHTAVIPVAGDQITNDIAVVLRTPKQSAHEIKHKYGVALTQLADSDQSVDVPTAGDRETRKLSQQTLSEIIEPRIEELYGLIREELVNHNLAPLIRSGIVLTGGSSKMLGMVELAEEVFHMPVRLGMPESVSGLSEVVKNPIYATGVGLVQFGHKELENLDVNTPKEVSEPLLSRLSLWFKNNF